MTPAQRTQQIIADVAAAHGLRPRDLTGPDRRRTVCFARFEAMRAIRAATNLSTIQIGALFNRDHSSVLHALGTLKNSIASDLRRAHEAKGGGA